MKTIEEVLRKSKTYGYSSLDDNERQMIVDKNKKYDDEYLQLVLKLHQPRTTSSTDTVTVVINSELGWDNVVMVIRGYEDEARQEYADYQEIHIDDIARTIHFKEMSIY